MLMLGYVRCLLIGLRTLCWTIGLAPAFEYHYIGRMAFIMVTGQLLFCFLMVIKCIFENYLTCEKDIRGSRMKIKKAKNEVI